MWCGVFIVFGVISVFMLILVIFVLCEILFFEEREMGGLLGILVTYGKLLKDCLFMGYVLL